MSTHIDHAGVPGTAEGASRPLPRWLEVAWRYAISSSGPMTIAAAHFAASLLFLRVSSPAEFGIFSFVLVVVPLCLSMSSALLGAPIAGALNKGHSIDEAEMGTYFKTNYAYCCAAALGVFLLMLASRAGLAAALPLGVYGGAMALRWFARSVSYARHRPIPAVLSDIAYSALVIAGLFALFAVHRLTIATASLALLVAATASVAMFGRDVLAPKMGSWALGSLNAYWPVWRDLARWSLAGVVLTELTSNAHAYFVTFASGPKVFALLALGSLMMRPVSLVLSALPDMERPVMARRIAAGDVRGAFRTVNEFRTAAGAIFLATTLSATAVLIWFPHLIIKPGYDASSVLEVFGFWILITAVRTLRTPDAVFLQAAQEFSALARASARSSVVSLIATPLLLVVAGPVASLGGILLGDIVVTANIMALTRGWKRRHA